MERNEPVADVIDQQVWLRLVSRSNLPPLIITVAVTGGVQGKEVNPNHPETAEEIAAQVQDCYKLGATQVHLHVRNPDNLGMTSRDPAEYRKVNAMVREKCPEIIINNTSGGGMGAEDEEARLASTKANPEVCSLDMGPIVSRFIFRKRLPPLSGPRLQDIEVDGHTQNTYGETEKYARIMLEKGIKPEMEVWHTGQYWLVRNLIDRGLVKPPYMIQCVMGSSSGAYATPKELLHMIECAPKPSVLSVLSVGPMQYPMAALGIILGINVRTGMEDNVYVRKGVLCMNNAELVEKVVRGAREFDREIATPRQARQMLGLSEKPSRYD
jgi:3-keto-5-aminohexanoate cleavage enzyme